MTLTQLLVLLVIAAICGGIGQSLAGYDLWWLPRIYCSRIYRCLYRHVVGRQIWFT